MSVLIKGMEMPKVGNWKTIRIYNDGTCAEPNWQGDCKVMKGCEAVLIPDHGDLIDREKLVQMWKSDIIEDRQAGITEFTFNNREHIYNEFIDDVERFCKVVIPAERSEE